MEESNDGRSSGGVRESRRVEDRSHRSTHLVDRALAHHPGQRMDPREEICTSVRSFVPIKNKFEILSLFNNDECIDYDDVNNNNNNSNIEMFNYEEEFDFKYSYDEDVKYVRETKNSQEFTYVKNRNLCSGYFCDFIPLVDKNNNLNVPLFEGKYKKLISDELSKYNKNYMDNIGNKCSDIINKFFPDYHLMYYPNLLKTINYNYFGYTDQTITPRGITRHGKSGMDKLIRDLGTGTDKDPAVRNKSAAGKGKSVIEPPRALRSPSNVIMKDNSQDKQFTSPRKYLSSRHKQKNRGPLIGQESSSNYNEISRTIVSWTTNHPESSQNPSFRRETQVLNIGRSQGSKSLGPQTPHANPQPHSGLHYKHQLSPNLLHK